MCRCQVSPLMTRSFSLKQSRSYLEAVFSKKSKQRLFQIQPGFKNFANLTRTSCKSVQETYKIASQTSYKISCQDVLPRFLQDLTRLTNSLVPVSFKLDRLITKSVNQMYFFNFGVRQLVLKLSLSRVAFLFCLRADTQNWFGKGARGFWAKLIL